jgi:hypothetical protein
VAAGHGASGSVQEGQETMSRGLKICAMSIVLATFAPLILLTLWTKDKVGHRWHRVLRTAGFHLSTQRDQWTREVTLYEILTGEIPRKRRK